MPTDPIIITASNAETKRNSDVVIGTIWLVLYVGMLVGTLTDSLLVRAIEFTRLY